MNHNLEKPKKQPEGDANGIAFRMSFIHWRTGKRVYSKTGRPFPIGSKKRKQ